MKQVVAGRNMSEDSEAGVASAAAIRTGAVIKVPMLSPACAAEQIEQAWCDVVESSGWLCTAWATPITHTSTIESTQITLVNRLRFAAVLTISFRRLQILTGLL